MAASEKIRIVMLKKKVGLNQLGEMLGKSPQNLSGKFRRDNLSENDMREIAEALGCDLEISFIDKETREILS